MKGAQEDLWLRAKDTIEVAEYVLVRSPDNSASRSYYAAFYAVSALFRLEGRSFRRHSALESAVHRDLVKTGRFERSVGEDFMLLVSLREKGDYGDEEHVTPDEARRALESAKRVLSAVQSACPQLK